MSNDNLGPSEPKWRSAQPFFPRSAPHEYPQNDSYEDLNRKSYPRSRRPEEYYPESSLSSSLSDMSLNPQLPSRSQPFYPSYTPRSGVGYQPPTSNFSPVPQTFLASTVKPPEMEPLPIQGETLPPLNHHLYMYSSSHTTNLPPNIKTSNFYAVNEEIRQRLVQKNEAKNSFKFDGTEPQEIGSYHSISRIDDSKDRTSSVFRFHTSLYKAISSMDGSIYCLRRVEGYRAPLTGINSELWKRINHPNIVTLRDCFITKQFGDNSLVFVYDYHANAQTLYEKHFSVPTQPMNEKLIWSYLIQIVSAMRVVHATGRACRVINLTKIILTSKNRLRLSSIGMPDILSFDNMKSPTIFQQEDFTNLGYLILTLACNSIGCLHNIPKAMDLVSRNFSPSLKSIIEYLISVNMKSVDELIRWIAPKMMSEIENIEYQNDFLEEELSKELENGRIVRVLCKLGFINDRPEYEMDPAWSETGDRYLIMLFRDYIFHQVDENNDPILSLSHVIQNLNKLDAGYPEKIMLMSRDEQSCIIVSYKDLKRCVEEAFQELSKHRRTN